MNDKPTREELRNDPNLRDNSPRIVSTNRPRITVVSNVYHQIPGEQIDGPPHSRFYRWLESDEQAYSRTIKVGVGWQELDLGWLKDKEGYSILVIINSLKRLPSRIPTPEEEQEFYSKVLEIGLMESDNTTVTPIAYVPIGEDLRLPPLNIKKYRIRSQTPDGKYTIFLVPM